MKPKSIGPGVFTLHIEGFNPNTRTLNAIGHYFIDFAKLLGVEACFHSIGKGSTKVCAIVPGHAESAVRKRLLLVHSGAAKGESKQAYVSLLDRLAADAATKAAILDPGGANLLNFPIAGKATSQPISGLTRSGALQGIVIRVGGTGPVVPVHIQDVDGHIYLCEASRELAAQLGKSLFARTVRVFGSGTWLRDEKGVWSVQDFTISGIENDLDESTLRTSLREIRKIDGEWKASEDPHAGLDRIRHGERSE